MLYTARYVTYSSVVDQQHQAIVIGFSIAVFWSVEIKNKHLKTFLEHLDKSRSLTFMVKTAKHGLI